MPGHSGSAEVDSQSIAEGRAAFDGPAAAKVNRHDRHSDAGACVDGMGSRGVRAAAHSRHVPARKHVSHHSVTHERTMRADGQSFVGSMN